jgi:hypothetical protein
MTVNIYDMAQTWNNGATTFAGIKLNVTDTASAATSKLLDLQVGGVSQCSVIKTGTLAAVAFTAIGSNKSSFTIGTNLADLTQFGGVNALRLIAGSANRFSGLQTTNALTMLALTPASNTTEIINGVNAQAFNIYNTYTDASNYERGFMKWNSNVLQIGTEAAGTGTSRALKLSSSSVSGITIDANGNGIYFGGPLIPYGTRDVGHLSAPFRNIIFSPGSSITPTLNGTVTIEATNNTTLTFKLKGSDGTVRSGTVTLS